MQIVETRRPHRQDTYDLRDQIHADDHPHQHADAANFAGTDDEEHSVLEDDSDGEEREVDYMEEDDGSSSLSIPNESIDFDLVYSLHSFAATVEGQANVVKGDSLFLMDDSNSYWWLVRVLKTQEVGYIPAENIETPFERLARLNKHRNVDLASATQAELQEDVHRLRNNLSSRQGSNQTPSPDSRGPFVNPRPAAQSNHSRGVSFTAALSVHRYPPAVWNEEEEEEADVEWDDEAYEGEDPGLAEEQMQQRRADEGEPLMEPDDGMAWEDSVAAEMQSQQIQGWAPQSLHGLAPVTSRSEPTSEQPQLQAQKQSLVAQQQQQQQQQQLLLQQQQQLQQVTASVGQGHGQQQSLRQQTSRERITSSPEPATQSATKYVDPAEVTETRKVTVTPTIVRDVTQQQTQNLNGPLLPSALMQKQEEERKRTREEIEALEESARKKGKMATPVGSGSLSKVNGGASGAKLRKERDPEEDRKEKEREREREREKEREKEREREREWERERERDREREKEREREREKDKEKDREKEKKKKGSVFGGLFGRKKDKIKDKNTSSSASIDSEAGRGSEESSRSSNRPSVSASAEGMTSPTTVSALQQQQQQQQQQQALHLRNSSDPKRATQQPQQPQPQQQSQPASSPPPQVSQLAASQLRQRDQQQQALYQQYLNRSPSSPPEAQPSYGLQSASAVLQGSASYNTSASSASGLGLGPPISRPRPGSLILTANAVDGQGVGVPDLSVIRVFAGKNVQTEATFKTVLLNSSTTSSDLVRQAIQRFRLPAGDDEDSYYLTVKQVEGSSAVLRPNENPLGVFETLVEEAMELPKVKRSSVGSISSVASNLSMHPAIKKLPMNDFTDDSAVKFYLNRKTEEADDSVDDHGGDDTLLAESSIDESETRGSKSQYLSVSTSHTNNVTPERFSSPSFRFALQLVIYPEDLPDDMVFDPLTEAIIFKHTLRDRSQSSPMTSPDISQNMRRKVFVFPKNVTVAEVIELGLERFGISEGVVDGGDEVEDKLTKRRSSIRVRYGLAVDLGNQERELSPSSRIIDAFPKPPTFRAVERRFADHKRRSADSGQLLGTLEDVQSDDPIFILRRAVSYRNSTSRHRTSAPLDELALAHLHMNRESVSHSSASSDVASSFDDTKHRQPSRQEIIAAQRAASRANQRAILSAQTNSLRGVDVLLPGNAMIRSSRYEVGDKMRYSYVEPDGETYDISDIVEEEWRENNSANKNDLLEGVLVRNKDGLGEKLDRVLNKIKGGKCNPQASVSQSASGSTVGSASEYSTDEPANTDASSNSRSETPVFSGRTPTPTAASTQRANSPHPRTLSPVGTESKNTRATPPTSAPKPTAGSKRQPSIASVMSDLSGYATPLTTIPSMSPSGSPPQSNTPQPRRKRPYMDGDDFGVSQMMAVIEFVGTVPKLPKPPLDPVDAMLFGRDIDMGSLHPQVRNIYADAFKQLEDMDQILNEFLEQRKGGL